MTRIVLTWCLGTFSFLCFVGFAAEGQDAWSAIAAVLALLSVWANSRAIDRWERYWNE
jgi:hypothetical protein